MFTKPNRKTCMYQIMSQLSSNNASNCAYFLSPSIFFILNTAADFAHLINPALVLIVSFVAIYAASVTFLFPLVLQEAKIPASTQFGRWLLCSAWTTNALYSIWFRRSLLCSLSLFSIPLPVSPIYDLLHPHKELGKRRWCRYAEFSFELPSRLVFCQTSVLL